jgi:hypothetical protein
MYLLMLPDAFFAPSLFYAYEAYRAEEQVAK